MRKIVVTEPNDPDWQTWVEDCRRETQELITSVKEGKRKPFRDIYRRKRIKEIYFASKGKPFYGRCAYCETPIADTLHVQIEHFRPKGGVKDENGKSVTHPGYYWLAYEWTNLLPSCDRCNQSKDTLFPVKGIHAQSPEELINEQPLLIHPISDNPEEHLFVDLTTGVLSALNDSERGNMHIKIFKMRERTSLTQERKKTQNAVRFKIIQFRETLNELKESEYPIKLIQEMIEQCKYFIGLFEGEESYTLAAISVLKAKGYSIKWWQEYIEQLESSIPIGF